MSVETSIRVGLENRAYDILVGQGLIADAGSHVAAKLKRKRTVIVTDTNVAAHHLAPLEASLAKAGIATDSIQLAPGEATKCFGELESLVSRLLDLDVERQDCIIALGGGVIGDLTGFAASILRRGVDFIQIPTTLLAQVDSSVGGKTGINMGQGKNLIGAFHQPKLVLCDTAALDTLPPREMLAGYAEVVKYGLINRPDFFDWLEEKGASLIAGDERARLTAIGRSCKAKAEVVAEDEREAGSRALLNLGHTFGHALEAECGYDGRLLHGEAVAIGMVLAFRLSERLGICGDGRADRIAAHLDAVGLPTSPRGIDADFTSRSLLDHMGQDKKVVSGVMTFVLARDIGQSFVTRDVSLDAVRATLDDALT